MAAIENYELEAELGRGGMEVVYAAKDCLIGRRVAIKVLAAPGGGSAEESTRYREALLKEARAAGQLSHQNIVTVYHAIANRESVYIVMELVDGKTLDQAFAEPGGTPLTDIMAALIQAAAALDYAHSQGVVHRDVKPGNFIIRPDGVLKLTDFGIAKLGGATGRSSTAMMGTPYYMSPEQIMEQHLDGHSDQFSLAVMAWTMLSGSRPFGGEDPVSVLYHIVHSRPSVGKGRNLPPVARDALEKALSKKPADRYATCGEFVLALSRATDPNVIGGSLVSRGSRTTRNVWILTAILGCGLAASMARYNFRSRTLYPTSAQLRGHNAAEPMTLPALPSGVPVSSPASDSPAREKPASAVAGNRESTSRFPVRQFVPPSQKTPEKGKILDDAPPAVETPPLSALTLPQLSASEPPKPRICESRTTAAPSGAFIWDGRLAETSHSRSMGRMRPRESSAAFFQALP